MRDCATPISDIPAGPELDALVAARVGASPPFRPSRSMVDAWRAFDGIRAAGFYTQTVIGKTCTIILNRKADLGAEMIAEGPDFPTAVCLAVLMLPASSKRPAC